ncbi:uncharacterized protein LOC132309032 [Cornus florida]|uniref:uncharacterized protein LOC132309032 n=1 Tax=Cornus florida TaxID=4283 RepID=UPI00289A97B2|nr:uncharacterized protein LOC132309032 [Cornus florida]
MNPLKCAFGVRRGNFLGFSVHRQGIDLDPTKARAITDIPCPCSFKQLKSFLGKVSYLRRFIPALAEVSHPFSTLIKGNAKFLWTVSHQAAFEKIKTILASSTTMYPHVRDQPLLLYLTSTDKSIGALLVQTVNWQERSVYYLSRLIREAEACYSAIERHCLALVFTTQKFREGVAVAFTCYAPLGIKSQALADLLAQFPEQRHEPLDKALHLDELQVAAIADCHGEWKLAFDGSSTSTGGKAGIILTSLTQQVATAFKLAFRCSNNEAEYEELILSLLETLDKGISRLCVFGDSKLVIKQVMGEYAIRKPSLASYRTIIQKLLARFSSVRFLHVPRSNIWYPDALAMLASKQTITDDMIEIHIIKCIGPAIIAELFPVQIVPDNDWRALIISQLKQQTRSLPLTQLKSFQLLQGLHYFRLLARYLGPSDAEAALIATHEQHCATPLVLYRRLQRQGYFWPNMAA